MKNYLLTGLLLLMVSLIFMGAYSSMSGSKTAYIQNFKVYEEFKGKQELAQRFTKQQDFFQNKIDSVKLQLNILTQQLNQNPEEPSQELIQSYQYTQTKYAQLQQELAQKTTELQEKYMQQIWNQLNEYIKEYGLEHNYDYIYGAEGTGSIMYAKESNDITDKIIPYVNSKYEGF